MAQLPTEIRLKIWDHCMDFLEDRYLILSVALDMTRSHHDSSQHPERIVAGGSFAPAWSNHALPIHPIESQLMINKFSALCHETRWVVRKRYPDLVWVEKNRNTVGTCSLFTHDYEAWQDGGFGPQRLLLRCNLRKDILWAHSAPDASREVSCYGPVDFALGVYRFGKNTQWGPVRADLFTQTLKSVRHVVVSVQLLDDHTPSDGQQIQDLLAGMPLLQTLALQEDGRIPEPFRRTRVSGSQSQHTAIGTIYAPLRHRFVSDRCHSITAGELYNTIKRFNTHRDGLREALRVARCMRGHSQTVDDVELSMPEEFTMVAGDEDAEAHSRGKNVGAWIIRI